MAQVIHDCDCSSACGCNQGLPKIGCYHVKTDLDKVIPFDTILELEGYGTENQSEACTELLQVYNDADYHALEIELSKWYAKYWLGQVVK